MVGVLKLQDANGVEVPIAVENVGTAEDPAWALVTAGSGSSGGGSSSGVQRGVQFTTETGPGEIAAGARSISISNTGELDGTVLGGSLPVGSSYALQVDGNDTLEAVTFDATGTTFVVSVIR